MGDDAGDCEDERSRWTYTKKGGKKSEVSVWVMRQVTVRIEGQDALT